MHFYHALKVPILGTLDSDHLGVVGGALRISDDAIMAEDLLTLPPPTLNNVQCLVFQFYESSALDGYETLALEVPLDGNIWSSCKSSTNTVTVPGSMLRNYERTISMV